MERFCGILNPMARSKSQPKASPIELGSLIYAVLRTAGLRWTD